MDALVKCTMRKVGTNRGKGFSAQDFNWAKFAERVVTAPPICLLSRQIAKND